jgi:hypothetical protein
MMTVMPRFSIRSLLVFVVLIAMGIAWYADRTRLRQEQLAAIAAAKTTHHYVLAVDGTPGVQLAMTLITRPANKRTETITVPFSLEVDANAAMAWFEYLPNGQSGNDGDEWAVTLKKDGLPIAESLGTIKKDARKTVYVNGHVQCRVGEL